MDPTGMFQGKEWSSEFRRHIVLGRFVELATI